MPAALLLKGVPRLPALLQKGEKTGEAAAEPGLKNLRIQSPGRPQAQHDPLYIPIHRGDPVPLRKGRVMGGDALYIGIQILDIGKADAAHVRMGPGAESGVLLQGPVLHIMSGFPARLCKIGDLILDIALPGQEVHCVEIHICLLLVPGEAGGVLFPEEGGALLYLQAVAGEMIRGQGGGSRQVFPPLAQGLMGQAVDEIQGEVFKFRLPGGVHGGLYLIHGVDAANLRQFPVVGGLHPQGQAVEPCPPEGPEGLPVPGGVRIGLQGDFRPPGDGIAFQNGFQDFDQPFFPQIAGGSAAEINGVHQIPGGKGGHFRQMDLEGVYVIVHPGLRPRQGVEVAVCAFFCTEGNVDVQPQRLFVRFHDGFLPDGTVLGRRRIRRGDGPGCCASSIFRLRPWPFVNP